MTRDPANVSPLMQRDPYLKPYAGVLKHRQRHIETRLGQVLAEGQSLTAAAGQHHYFGLHKAEDHWFFREWAPNATSIHLVGDPTDWKKRPDFRLNRVVAKPGVWELRLPITGLTPGNQYRLHLEWPGGSGDRIPAYANRVVQNVGFNSFNACVPEQTPFVWQHDPDTPLTQPPLIYEAHIGMAQEAPRIGTYGEFTDTVLPRIVAAGYNVLQLMAIQEHPYYASFGYQVANFFAPSSRYGPPVELKRLVDAAHGAGLRVTMDLVHSHAVQNEVEGLSRFDGSEHQYFHDGARGRHPAWGSRCFDYAKPEVLRFLLSNCRYWLEEFHLDGFRFDGVTSMLYHHHGLNHAFTSYDDYFNDQVDVDALAYLALANRLVHEINPHALTIAEDVSGLPGLAAPLADGGIGFDYRFAMGIADHWIRLTKDTPDEAWQMGRLWFELNHHRGDEGTIAYAESHDQALVGDQTLMFRMAGSDLYHHMAYDQTTIRVQRAVAVHKMIRLITLTTAPDGYLNFMGNEFGHPEWIDFPRLGNQWSYAYARRQWSLADNPRLLYHHLACFDQCMIDLARRENLLHCGSPQLLLEHDQKKLLIFSRGGWVVAFNFHPHDSYKDLTFDAPAGEYRQILDSDASEFGGHGRLASDQHHFSSPAQTPPQGDYLSIYLPSRTAVVLQRVPPT